MPYLYQHNKVAVPIEELVPAWWGNYNALKLQVYRYKDKNYGVKRLQRGCRNREMLIDYDTLDKEVRLALGDPRILEHVLERYYTRDVKAVDYYNNYERPVFGALDDAEKERYIINASVFEAIIKLEKERTKGRQTMRMKAGKTTTYLSVAASLHRDAVSFNAILEKKHRTQHSLPSHQRRFSQKFNAYKKDGYYSLIKDPTGAGRANARLVCATTERLLNDLFSGQPYKPYMAEVHAQYMLFLAGKKEVVDVSTGEVYNPKNFKKLSDGTVYNYLMKWKNRIGTHEKRGNNRQRLLNQYTPHHQMKHVQYAGSLLSIDDRQPPFLYEGNKRVWYYMALDVASEYFVSWVSGKSKKGIIIDFYKQLVRDYAEIDLPMPDALECESSLNSSFVDTFLKAGEMFQHVRIEANNARGKFIENVFGRLRYMIERKLKGFRPRPFAKNETRQGDDLVTTILSYDTIVATINGCIAEWNNMPHPRVAGKTRAEVFFDTQHPNLKPTNYKSIIHHLGNTTKTSVHNGHLKFRRDKYVLGKDGAVALGDTLTGLMDALDNKAVTVKWLDNNHGQTLKAHIYHKEKYICEALPPPRYARAPIEQGAEDKANRKLYSRYVASVTGQKKASKDKLSDVRIIDTEIKENAIKQAQEREVEVLADIPKERVYSYTPKVHEAEDMRKLFDK